MNALMKKFESKLSELSNAKRDIVNSKISNSVDKAIHDIQSPLDALSTLIDCLEMSNEEKTIFNQSLRRINEIISFIDETKKITIDQNVEDLTQLMLDVIEEKKLISKNDVIFEVNTKINNNFSVRINTSDFSRALSNLINNSIEANSTKVIIDLSNTNEGLIIKLIDNGKGIPKNIINKIGSKGITFNKLSGSGIGLFQVKEFLKEIKGKFDITSKVGIGTTIRVEIPVNIAKNDFFDYVLIDDDELVRFNWKIKAQKANKSILILESAKKLDLNDSRISKKHTVFCIDCELKDFEKGDLFAEKLNKLGFEKINIITGHKAEKFKHLDFANILGKKPLF